MKGEHYIYVYLDPRKPGEHIYGEYVFSHEPIYIGKGKRKRAYYFEKRNGFLKKKMAKFGKPIVRVIAQGLTEPEAFVLEKKLITLIGRYNADKGPLCNLIDGGSGTANIPLTSEHKQKIGNANRGRKQSRESILKGIETRKRNGWRPTEEHIQKIRTAITGIKRSEETRKRISLAKKGKMSESTLLKMSQASKGRFFTEEARKKMSDAKKGKPRKPLSEETKRKISMSNKGRKKTKTHCLNISKARKEYFKNKNLLSKE